MINSVSMYRIHEEDCLTTEDVDSDNSIYDDEDELTKIIPPEGILFYFFSNSRLIVVFTVEDTKECLKARHILGLLGFLGFANVYAMRVNLSVAIVAMVNNTAFPQPINNNSFDHCPVPNVTNSTILPVTIFVSRKHIFIKLLLFLERW